jgi:hypothetical protein
VRTFHVEAVALEELEQSAAWYEEQREGLGVEFVAEVKRVLLRISQASSFGTAPLKVIEGGVIRREFVERFPYVVLFVETSNARRVIMIRRGNSNPARWRSRV